MVQDMSVVSLRRSSSIRRLGRSGVDRDDRGWTSLHVSARKGDLKQVKRLLYGGMDVNVPASGPKSPGVTALHLAAQGGHVKVMDVLLERGANIDARTKGAGGWTPLHTAAKETKKEDIKYLVENGAFLPDDINDCRFNPPLHYCPGLEWAYEELKRLQDESSSSAEHGVLMVGELALAFGQYLTQQKTRVERKASELTLEQGRKHRNRDSREKEGRHTDNFSTGLAYPNFNTSSRPS